MTDQAHVIDAIPLEERQGLPGINHVVKALYTLRLGIWTFVTLDAENGYPDEDHGLRTRRNGITQFQVHLNEGRSFIFPYMRLRTQVYTPYRRLYFNLQPISDTEIHFCAEYTPLSKNEWAYHHEFYLWMDDGAGNLILGRNGSGPRDPDILNPGDHP